MVYDSTTTAASPPRIIRHSVSSIKLSEKMQHPMDFRQAILKADMEGHTHVCIRYLCRYACLHIELYRHTHMCVHDAHGSVARYPGRPINAS